MTRAPWIEVAETVAARAYWLVAGFSVTLITARALGPEGRGVAAASVASVQLFALLVMCSLPNVIYFATSQQKRADWLPSVAGTILGLTGALSIVGWILAAVAYAVTGGRAFNNIAVYTLFVAFVALPFFMFSEAGVALLTAAGRLRLANLAQVAGATVTILGGASLLIFGVRNTAIAVVAIVSYQCVVAILSLTLIRREAGSLVWSAVTARQLLASAIRFHPATISTFVLMQANVLIVNFYRSPADTAFYQLAIQLVSAAHVIPTAISSVTYQMIAKHGVDQSWPRQRTLLLNGAVLMTLITLAAYGVAPWLIEILVGPAFAPATEPLRILLLSLVAASVCAIMASQWIARGLFVQVSAISVLLATGTLVANLMVVPRSGIVGAAWVTVVTYTVAMIINLGLALWVARRHRIESGSDTPSAEAGDPNRRDSAVPANIPAAVGGLKE